MALKQFNNIPGKTNTKGTVKKQTKPKPTDNITRIKIDKDVTVVLADEEEVDYSLIRTLPQLIELDLAKPHLISHFEPPLNELYVDRVNKSINTYVELGDNVTANTKYRKKTEVVTEAKVERIYLKSLNDMSVVLIKLENGEIHPAHTLKPFELQT